MLYIGAGAVAAGWHRQPRAAMPTIWHGLRAGLRDLRRRRALRRMGTCRAPSRFVDAVVLVGTVALMAAIVLARPLHMNLLGAILIVAFGFLFVTVSSRLTGEIGSSSNPISGMTVATLLFTCIIFLLAGWTGRHYYVTALSVGSIVCIAASNGGRRQDLKTGFLIGGTPRAMQIAILIGSLASALLLGPILLQLDRAATTYVPVAQVAPGGLHTDPQSLAQRERLRGPQARADARTYRVWHKPDSQGGPEGKYLSTRGRGPSISSTRANRPPERRMDRR